MENESFVGFNFVKGEECGTVDREAKVSEMILYILASIRSL